MKIAQVLFEMCQLGGIATQTVMENRAHKMNGHQADFFLIKAGRKSIDYPVKELTIKGTSSGLVIRQNILSVATPALIKKSKRILSTYDLLIFQHPCPHTTDKAWNRNWMEIYRTPPKKTVMFTDVYYEKAYKWLDDVRENMNKVVAMGEAHLRCAKQFEPKAKHFKNCTFIEGLGMPMKERNGLIFASAWRKWKGEEVMLDMAPDLVEPVHFFGRGRNYYDIRKARIDVFKRSVRKDFIAKVQYNPKGNANIYGQVDPKVVVGFQKKCSGQADLTGLSSKKYQGHYNRTTIEPMALGCPVICFPELIKGTHIPKECVVLLDPESPADSLNSYLKNKKKLERIRKRAFEFVSAEHDVVKEVEVLY